MWSSTMIRSLFKELADRPHTFLDARTGRDFEDRMQSFMRNTMHYNRLLKKDIAAWEQLRGESLRRSDDAPIRNVFGVDRCYIYQPNGSQDYPDFMVFEHDQVVCLEVKFSKQPHPVWNSGLPRPNGFYILGCSATKDITFFHGRDVVTRDESKKLHEFFDHLKAEQQRFNEQHMSGQSHGFAVYIRKAFEQKKMYNPNANTNYYGSAERNRLQKNVLEYFK